MVYTYCFVCRTLYYVFLWTNISFMLLSRLNDTMGGSGNIFFSRLDWWGIFRCLRRMAWMFGRTLEYVITNGTLSFSFLSLYCRRSSRLSSSTFCSCSSINELLYPLFFKCVFISLGSLRLSQFSGCWLILSVYIIMSLDFPFVRLFGVR